MGAHLIWCRTPGNRNPSRAHVSPTGGANTTGIGTLSSTLAFSGHPFGTGRRGLSVGKFETQGRCGGGGTFYPRSPVPTGLTSIPISSEGVVSGGVPPSRLLRMHVRTGTRVCTGCKIGHQTGWGAIMVSSFARRVCYRQSRGGLAQVGNFCVKKTPQRQGV